MSRANLLLLPGLLENEGGFAEVIQGLERHGIACTVADMTGADSIAGLAASALAQAPSETFLLAGHSMGGYVALEIMRRAPQRVSRLALLNTHARPDSPESIENRRRLMALAERDFDAVTETLMPKLLLPAHLGDARLRALLVAMARATGVEAFKRQQAAIIGRIDSRPHLKDIRVPTLVIAARGDAIMPVEILKELADGIPGARLAIVEDSGHMASLERPAAVLEPLREWATA
jgi:pimeloyl-ACP methyl ester carboxylesterase